MDPEIPGHWETWTLKNLDPEKCGISMGLKIMSNSTELDFLKTMRIVIWISSFTSRYLIFFRLEIVPNNSTVKWHIGKVEPGARDTKYSSGTRDLRPIKWNPGRGTPKYLNETWDFQFSIVLIAYSTLNNLHFTLH